MNISYLRWFSIAFALCSLFLPLYSALYSAHVVFVDISNKPYLHIYTEVSLIGEFVRFKFSETNLTYTVFSFIGSDFANDPFSSFLLLRFAAFLLALFSIFLVLYSSFFNLKPKLLDYGFRLMLDSILLAWAPVIFFDILKHPTYANFYLVSVFPSYGFFTCLLTLAFIYFYHRNVKRDIFLVRKVPTERRILERFKKIFKPSYSVHTPALSSKIMVSFFTLTLLIGIIFSNYVLSVLSTHNLRIHGIPFHKGVYKTYKDTPDIHFSFNGTHLTMYFIGGVSNPSQVFIVLKKINLQIYLDDVAFGNYTVFLNRLLYPQETSFLNLEVSMSTESISEEQIAILNQKSSPFVVKCLIEADSQSLPFFFECKDEFCFYVSSWVS